MEIPLEVVSSVLPARGGEDLLRKLFEPLGYEILTEQLPLDENFPEWGDSSFFKVILREKKRLQDLLAHLYVLLPVLDNEKHYWVGDEEVEKLLRRVNPWLAPHPERETIARRYLKFRSSLAREVIARLMPEETLATEIEFGMKAKPETSEEVLEKPLSLNEQRYKNVIDVLKSVQAKRVVDVGYGERRLLRHLLFNEL